VRVQKRNDRECGVALREPLEREIHEAKNGGKPLAQPVTHWHPPLCCRSGRRASGHMVFDSLRLDRSNEQFSLHRASYTGTSLLCDAQHGMRSERLTR
jgi:hypothetical protein